VKKKLLVLLGAGSSVEQGFPTTGELDDEVNKWAGQFVRNKAPDPIDSLDTRTRADFYGHLWANRENYCSGLTIEQKAIVEPRTKPNYERVLGDLHALMNGVLPKPYGDPILKWIPKADVFDSLRITPDSGDLDEHGSNKVFYAVQAQLQNLCNRLAERIRDRSCGFEAELSNGRGTAAFDPYRRLMDGLAREFEIGVYNLNYDTVALKALPKAFVGFDRRSGQFLPAEVLGRTEWRFVYHLHGSVHHRMKNGSHTMEDDDFGPKVIWYDDLSQRGDPEHWEDSAHLTTQSDEKRVLLTSIVAGGWKLDQLQEEPFLTLYSCLPRHAYEANAILVGGYGFGDSHINSILKTALRSKANDKKRPPILVLDYDKNGQPVAKRGGPWTGAMRNTLRVSPQSFRSPEHRAQPNWIELPDRITRGQFEQSTRVPVAIWSWGFSAASQQLSEIVEWLDGDPSAL